MTTHAGNFLWPVAGEFLYRFTKAKKSLRFGNFINRGLNFKIVIGVREKIKFIRQLSEERSLKITCDNQ